MIFFLILSPPATPTPFPYTPLFRSLRARRTPSIRARRGRLGRGWRRRRGGRRSGEGLAARSEEHTSELQSRGQLVCRLLPAKKKNRYTRPPAEYPSPTDREIENTHP